MHDKSTRYLIPPLTWVKEGVKVKITFALFFVKDQMLSPPQRPLSCCFVAKGGRGPGERGKRQRARNVGKGKERREAKAPALSLFPSFPARPPKPTIIKKNSHREPLQRREDQMYRQSYDIFDAHLTLVKVRIKAMIIFDAHLTCVKVRIKAVIIFGLALI